MREVFYTVICVFSWAFLLSFFCFCACSFCCNALKSTTLCYVVRAGLTFCFKLCFSHFGKKTIPVKGAPGNQAHWQLQMSGRGNFLKSVWTPAPSNHAAWRQRTAHSLLPERLVCDASYQRISNRTLSCCCLGDSLVFFHLCPALWVETFWSHCSYYVLGFHLDQYGKSIMSQSRI